MTLALQIFLVPRNILILAIKVYRRIISPLYGNVCRYYPSCSSYGLQQVQQRGVFAGSVLTIIRIVKCNPWAEGGFDEVEPSNQRFQVSTNGFVIAKPKKGN
jgi:putative membrane protein insertion efficiency factor